MPLPRLRSALLAFSCLLGFATGCSSSEANPDDSLVKRADERGKLTIGIRYDQPGLSQRTVDGRYVGFDVDVARFVAVRLGVDDEDITWRETPASQREAAIATGAVDFVVGTYSITDDRKNQVYFAGPYFETGQSLLVRLKSQITGPGSLNGKKLCSVTGSTSAQKVKDEFAQGVELKQYLRYRGCVDALLYGEVDAVTTDGVILAGYVAEHPELLKVVGVSFSEERYGIGLRLGDTEGQRAVNSAIEEMVDSGEWREAFRRNIGPSGYPIPAPPTVTEG